MTMVKVLYTSDMHGNQAQYKTLVEYAQEIKPDAIIIGGELYPKGSEFQREINQDYLKRQGDFIVADLPQLLKPLRPTPVYLMPGNDDCDLYDTVLDEYAHIFTNIDQRRAPFPAGLEIVGYSNVPITPFGLKDRERFDLKEVPQEWIDAYDIMKKGYNLHGIKSTLGKNGPALSNFSFNEDAAEEFIQTDLAYPAFTRNPQKTIYVFHTPTLATALDITEFGLHIGSFAVKQFIEQHQPYLTLHGHIHETVDMSGEYKHKIGNSLGMSAGNHNYDSKLAVLVFDTDDPSQAVRKKIPCTTLGKLRKRILGF